MEIKEIRTTLAVTVNLGNYENARIEEGATANVAPDEDPDRAFKELYSFVEDRLNESVVELHSSMSKDARRNTKILPKE